MRSGLRSMRAATAIALVAIAASACQQPSSTGDLSSPAAVTVVTVDGGSYQRIPPATLATMLVAKDFTLVNVHVPYEGEIEPTDLSIPFDTIESRLADLPATDQRIVLYCQTGRMSAIAAEALVKAGYTDVWDLAGGMEAWKASGQPLLERPPG